jgi:hypothetical protein
MRQYDSRFVSSLSSDEQVVSYLLDMRTRTLKFVINVLEAIDRLQDAKSDVGKRLSTTQTNNDSYISSRPPLWPDMELSPEWHKTLTVADSKLLIAAQSIQELRAVVHAFAGDNCSFKVRNAIRDVKASQDQLENKLSFARSLVAELASLNPMTFS